MKSWSLPSHQRECLIPHCHACPLPPLTSARTLHACKFAQVVVAWEASDFYEEAGVAAAALGVCVDVYAVCPAFVGLDLLHPLAARSGGMVRLYPSTEDAPLPQVGVRVGAGLLCGAVWG